jgi:hypothetical protein
VGGAAKLGHRLHIPVDDVRRWLQGNGRPSMGTFLRVVDVLLEESQKPRLVCGDPAPQKRAAE